MFPLVALALAAVLAGCGDDPEPPNPTELSVCDVVEDVAAEEPISVPGEGRPIQRVAFGFELADSGCSVFVAATPRQVADVEAGDELAVKGIVRPLRRAEAKRIDFALRRGPGPARQPQAATETGDAFLDSFAIDEVGTATGG